MKRGAYLVVTLFLLVPLRARGQAPTAVVSEAVTASSGAPRRETRIVASRPDASAIRSVSTDEFREPSVFTPYRRYILGAVALLLMQTGLIAGLWIHRRNGRAAERALREKAEEALRDNDAAPRQTHAEIEDFAGRLIAAQEAERARVARKLHDDISQRLAVISIALSECQRSELGAGGALLDMLSAVQQQIISLVEDVRLLSHDLHPGALEHADLVDALRSHCDEFAKQHSLSVVVDADGNLAIPDLTTALCLYRVVQEALRNIAKHAKARQVQVTMRRVGEEVQLAVADDGIGFNLAKAREEGGGLGLRSIEERIRLVDGRLSIETAPLMGVTITVSVKNMTAAVAENTEGPA